MFLYIQYVQFVASSCDSTDLQISITLLSSISSIHSFMMQVWLYRSDTSSSSDLTFIDSKGPLAFLMIEPFRFHAYPFIMDLFTAVHYKNHTTKPLNLLADLIKDRFSISISFWWSS